MPCCTGPQTISRRRPTGWTKGWVWRGLLLALSWLPWGRGWSRGRWHHQKQLQPDWSKPTDSWNDLGGCSFSLPSGSTELYPRTGLKTIGPGHFIGCLPACYLDISGLSCTLKILNTPYILLYSVFFFNYTFFYPMSITTFNLTSGWFSTHNDRRFLQPSIHTELKVSLIKINNSGKVQLSWHNQIKSKPKLWLNQRDQCFGWLSAMTGIFITGRRSARPQIQLKPVTITMEFPLLLHLYGCPRVPNKQCWVGTSRRLRLMSLHHLCSLS